MKNMLGICIFLSKHMNLSILISFMLSNDFAAECVVISIYFYIFRVNINFINFLISTIEDFLASPVKSAFLELPSAKPFKT